jgi:hypothetical protein
VLHSEPQCARKHITDLVSRLVRQHLVCCARCEFREVRLEGECGEVAQAIFSERGNEVIIQNPSRSIKTGRRHQRLHHRFVDRFDVMFEVSSRSKTFETLVQRSQVFGRNLFDLRSDSVATAKRTRCCLRMCFHPRAPAHKKSPVQRGTDGALRARTVQRIERPNSEIGRRGRKLSKLIGTTPPLAAESPRESAAGIPSLMAFFRLLPHEAG